MRPLSPSAVHVGFDEQVLRRPSAVAITHAGRDVSYGELNARAGAIAEALGLLGLPRETRVGIYLPRIPDLVATMFATGMRYGELMALCVTDVRDRVVDGVARGMVIRVRRSIAEVNGQPVEWDYTKTESGQRDIPVSAALASRRWNLGLLTL